MEGAGERQGREKVDGLSARATSWLAWTMWALSTALTMLSIWLLVLGLSRPNVPVYPYWAEGTLLAVGYSTVGAVVASRRPQNPIGWILCAIGLSWGAAHFNSEYATYALLAVPGSLLAGELAAWLYSWLWVPGLGLIVFLALLFPGVDYLLLAGVPSRGSASSWWRRERSWRRSLPDRSLALCLSTPPSG